jgi:hypothetical protein
MKNYKTVLYEDLDSENISTNQLETAFNLGLIPKSDKSIFEVYYYVYNEDSDNELPNYIVLDSDNANEWIKKRFHDKHFPGIIFIAPNYSEELIEAFYEVRDEYLNIKADIELMKYNDSLYEDPSWWDIQEEYYKYVDFDKCYKFKGMFE